MASKLNKKQKDFVQAKPGSLIAIAGPGTGKTHSLIEKIKFNKDKKILALTFTNKAAAEIKDRLGRQKGVGVHTFHSLCLKILQKQIDFRLLPEYESLLIAQKLKQKYSLKKTPKQILYKISKLKNRSPLPPWRDRDDASVSLRACLRRQGATATWQSVMDSYGKHLQRHNYLDWDDLINESIKLDKKYIPNYDLILIDEFQDTNPKQLLLIKHIADNDNICVIGDPKQSIYSFRGAHSGVFDQFKKQYSNYFEIVFDINYRSDQKIINLANKIYPKQRLIAKSKNTGNVFLVKTPTRLSEAKFIFEVINQKVGGVNLIHASNYSNSKAENHFRDFAVIYRKHSDAKFIKKILDEEGVPVQQIGEQSPFNSLKAQKMIAYMRETGENYTQAKSILGYEVSELKELADRFGDMTNDLLNYIEKISEVGYWDYLGDKITLCTIHSAKGLEFEHVFISQFNAINFPQRGADEDEEKRLFYVAVTRAKKSLYLIKVGKQSKYNKYLKGIAEKIDDLKGYKSLERSKIKKLKKSQMGLF